MKEEGEFFLLFVSRSMLTPKILFFSYKKLQQVPTQKNKKIFQKIIPKLYNYGVITWLGCPKNAIVLSVFYLLRSHKHKEKSIGRKENIFPPYFLIFEISQSAWKRTYVDEKE
jgi:hypothetical protein